MGPQTVPQSPKVVELLQIALGGMAGLVAGALAGAAAFQSVVMALAGGMGGAVFGLIAALKHVEGEDGRGRPAKEAVAPTRLDRPLVEPPAQDGVRRAGADPRLPRRSAA